MNSKILTCDDEVTLGRRVRGGDQVARNELVQHHLPFAVYLARSYGRRCRCWDDDLFQAARLGLLRGADAWDPDQCLGKRFLTFTRYYVRQEILAYLYNRPLIRIPHSARPSEMAKHAVGAPGWKEYRAWTMHCAARSAQVVQGYDEELNYPDPSQYLDIDDSYAKDLEQLRLGLELLPPWHAEVLRRRFGLGGRPRQTVRTIAHEAGISRQTVCNVQRAALQRLRKMMVTT